MGVKRIIMPVRTMQRKLEEFVVTYSQLVNKLRYSNACRLLQNKPQSVANIARATGYSDSNNFSRSFPRWSGVLEI